MPTPTPDGYVTRDLQPGYNFSQITFSPDRDQP